ncbi:hypothetical protein DRJ22_04015 [Candidatus Woesearchaeota archaeon]|nr:MAG: hypothetical protein B6U93_00410 [Candidatus Woesearchaeota archaeon ex4484_78]RLE45595.1 MAG: hypothetical protein DRJ22_04015 [Candidatus Woesearchaeota archaeon]
MKTLIGIPTYSKQEYCLEEFTQALKSQKGEYDILFVVNNGETAYASLIKSKGFKVKENPEKTDGLKETVLSHRKLLRKHALDNNYDYLLFLDSDIILPDKFAIQRLLAAQKDIITGVYLDVFEIQGQKVSVPFLLREAKGGGQLYTYQAMFPPRILEVGACGIACLLVSKKALEKTSFDNNYANEGIGFCIKSKKQGFKIWADTSVKCIHRAFPRDDKRAKVFEWLTNIEDYTYELKWPD